MYSVAIMALSKLRPFLHGSFNGVCSSLFAMVVLTLVMLLDSCHGDPASHLVPLLAETSQEHHSQEQQRAGKNWNYIHLNSGFKSQ